MSRQTQPDLFADAPAAAPAGPDIARVRGRLEKILSEARAADVLPWDGATLRLYRTIFPQMVRWLPADEAAALRAAFDGELARLAAG